MSAIKSAEGFYRTVSEKTTSIGPIGYAAQASSGRIRGFATNILHDSASISTFAKLIRDGIDIVDNSKEITRMNLRVVATVNALPGLQRSIPLGASVEAILPLSRAHTENPEEYIVYIGYNNRVRAVNPSEMSCLMDNVNSAFVYNGNTSYFKTRLDIVSNMGYTVNVFKNGEIGIVPKMLDSASRLLMLTYGYDSESASETLVSRENVVAVMIQSGSVVGLCVIESARVPLDGRELKIAELTDSVISPEHRTLKVGNDNVKIGSDLYLALTSYALHDAFSAGEYDVVFSESNLNKKDSILRCCALQGREFHGILPNQAEIYGKLTSLGVFSITPKKISEILRR